MILIADSGSTKTDWCIVFNGTLIKRIGTKGINPFFQSGRGNPTRVNCLSPATVTGRDDKTPFISTVQDVRPKKLPSSDGQLPTACPS